MVNGVNYFNLEDYLNNLEINGFVLEHLAEFQDKFDKYLKKVLSIGEAEAINFLTLELFNELLFSNQIEEDKILPPTDFLNNNLILSGQSLTNSKICSIQELLLKNNKMPYPIGEYRNVPVFIRHNGDIVYYAPESQDVAKFMNDFIKFYNKNNDSLLHNDPFIKAALIHFLFVKIHPFVDGNGRVSRILHNLKFTNLINKTYIDKNGVELGLKLAPLNISYSIFNNRQSYYDRLASIPFYEGADLNDSFNRWLEFLIYMYEEQLYYNEHSNKLKNLNTTLKRIRL